MVECCGLYIFIAPILYNIELWALFRGWCILLFDSLFFVLFPAHFFASSPRLSWLLFIFSHFDNTEGELYPFFKLYFFWLFAFVVLCFPTAKLFLFVFVLLHSTCYYASKTSQHRKTSLVWVCPTSLKCFALYFYKHIWTWITVSAETTTQFFAQAES